MQRAYCTFICSVVGQCVDCCCYWEMISATKAHVLHTDLWS